MKRLACLLLSLCVIGTGASAIAASSGTVVSLKGKADVMKLNAVRGSDAAVGTVINEEELLRTKRESSATVKLSDGSSVQVLEKSRLKIYSLTSASQYHINVQKGKVAFDVAKADEVRGEFRVKTSTSIIGVKGTKFQIVVTPSVTLLNVSEGRVAVAPALNPTNFQDVPAGKMAAIRPASVTVTEAPKAAPQPQGGQQSGGQGDAGSGGNAGDGGTQGNAGEGGTQGNAGESGNAGGGGEGGNNGADNAAAGAGNADAGGNNGIGGGQGGGQGNGQGGDDFSAGFAVLEQVIGGGSGGSSGQGGGQGGGQDSGASFDAPAEVITSVTSGTSSGGSTTGGATSGTTSNVYTDPRISPIDQNIRPKGKVIIVIR